MLDGLRYGVGSSVGVGYVVHMYYGIYWYLAELPSRLLVSSPTRLYTIVHGYKSSTGRETNRLAGPTA
jgi:hypothetical protein